MESKELDKFLGEYVELPRDDKGYKVLDHVMEWKRDHNGKFIGTSNENPILNTEVYNVETPDGHKAEYIENIIAEILYIQVDGDG